MNRNSAAVAGFGAAVIFIALTALLPLYITFGSTAEGKDTERPIDGVLPLQWAIIIWAAARLAKLYLDGEPRLMLLTFYAYVYVFLGISPLAQITTGYSPGQGHVTSAEELASAAIILVGLLAYEIGRLIKPRQSKHFNATSEFSGRMVWTLAIVGLVSSALYVQSIGVGALFAARNARFESADAALGGSQALYVVTSLATIPTLIAILGFVDMRRKAGKGYAPIITILTVDLLVLTNPISASRLTFGIFVGGLLIVTLRLCSTPKRTRRVMAVILVMLILVFPYADKFRKDIEGVELLSGAALADQFSTKMDYDSYSQVALGVRYVERAGNTYGVQAIGALLAPTPRALWPGKPEDTGIILARFAGYTFHSISAPLWIEAWIDGGLIGLVGIFLGFGFLSGRLDAGYILAVQRGQGVLHAAVPVLAVYQLITLRGSLLQQMSALMVTLLCFWVVRARVTRDLDEPKRRRTSKRVRFAGDDANAY